jgi:hypothetical protein
MGSYFSGLFRVHVNYDDNDRGKGRIFFRIFESFPSFFVFRTEPKGKTTAKKAPPSLGGAFFAVVLHLYSQAMKGRNMSAMGETHRHVFGGQITTPAHKQYAPPPLTEG